MLIRVTRTDAEDSHRLSFSLRPRILSELGCQKLLTAETAKNSTRVRGEKPDSQKLVVIRPLAFFPQNHHDHSQSTQVWVMVEAGTRRRSRQARP
jgi:hypothetical protein